MMMSDNLAEKILRDSKVVDKSGLMELKAEVKATHVPLSELILSRKLLTEEDLTKLYAEEVGIPYIKLSPAQLPPAYLKLLPEHMARRYRAVVFDVEPNDTKLVATDSPFSPEAESLLVKVLGQNYKLFMAPPSHLHSALDTYRNLSISYPSNTNQLPEQVTTDSYEGPEVLQTLNHIIDQAIEKKASVVHIEPGDKVVAIRFKIDGYLREMHKLPNKDAGPLVRRLKILCGLNSNSTGPGEFRIESHNGTYSINVAILPVIYGEKVTLKIHNESLLPPSLTEIGLWGRNLESAERSLIVKQGLILVAGPRDSGRSTTLYSLAAVLSNENLNVLTIEDTVTYKLPGASQVELNPTLPTYETALQAGLKQDTEVILLGQILDSACAGIVTDAATNNLVLTSVSAESSLDSLGQMTRFGIEPFLLAHNTHLIISGRLVKKLCDHCKEAIHPTNETLHHLIKALGLLGDGSGIKGLHSLEKKAASFGLGDLAKNDLSSTETSIKRLWRASDHGCVHCNYCGFSGRIGIQEVLEMTDGIKAKVAANSTTSDIQKLATKSGFIPLTVDGLIKALRGLTTVEEVLCLTR